MRKIVYTVILILLGLNAVGQSCKPSVIKLYVLPKTILTNIRITEQSIKEWDKEMMMPIIIEDELLSNKFLEFLPKNDSLHLPNYNSIDVRLLIEIDSCKIKTVSISNNGLLSINSNQVFQYSPDSVIELFKTFIPPNMEWYDVDSAVLQEYQFKKVMEQLKNRN